jgi:two-component system LytT family sensor kinase
MRRVSLHIAFWIVYLFQNVLLIFLLNTTRLQITTATNLILSFTNCLVLLLPKLLFTYFVLFVILDRIFIDRFSNKAALYSVFALLTALFFYRSVAVLFIDPIIYRWNRPESAFFYPLAFPVALMDIGFVSGAAIAIKQVRQQLRRTQVEQILLREKMETELKYLRNQTNPHFLFNTLNNIYALARKKSEQTPDAVMKLSKLLRFMLYDTAKALICIEDELRMLEDYIDLEKIRYDDKLTLSFLKDIPDKNEYISPLLLLPLVENAFKHGASESRFATFIYIEMKLQDSILTFIVKNSKENNGDKSACDAAIGLNNVKRQLELLYTEYDMQVLNETHVFIVVLTINLKSYAKNKLPHR